MLRITKHLFDRKLVPNNVNQQKERLLGLIREGQELATMFAEPTLISEIDQISASALKPFLFVIVGEVKSGKSSLINALLEAPICAVDSAPCTDRIQEINYGEEEQRIQVSEHEERLLLPHAILQHIAIVDTPGTNSIIRHHQVITEDYIPQSDLVLFVFFAKNPYTGSAWDFLRYIKHEWQRNTLFVLQQADLLPTEERKRTLAHIREQLVEDGIEDPAVFAVSVKTGSGVGDLRDYLRSEVVEGRQFSKVQSLANSLHHFVGSLDKLLRSHERLNQHDEMLLGKLHGLTLNLQIEAEVDRQVGLMMAECQQRAEEAQRRLRKRFQGQRSFLDKLDTLKNALASGHEVRQWLAEFFGHVQEDFSHALYQNQLRFFSDLHQRAQELAREMLEVLSAPPRQVKKSSKDSLMRQRNQMLSDIRERLATLDNIRPEETIHPETALGRLNRLLLGYRLAQGGAAFSLLGLGVYSGDPLTGLIIAAAGYVGVGYMLFSRNRERLQVRCSSALDASLADLETRLRSSLTEHLTGLQQLGDGAVGMFDRDLRNRSTQTDKLLQSLGEMRGNVERFQAAVNPAPGKNGGGADQAG